MTGWISLNSKNCDADNNDYVDVACGGDNASDTPIPYVEYKVTVNADGEFSGYAYSETHGYIDFNPASTTLGPYPEDPPHGVELDILDRDGVNRSNISGWARLCALAGDTSNCQDGIAGWIKFEDDAPIVFDTSMDKANLLHGYAFSDEIGYISWNCHEGDAGGGSICGDSNYAAAVRTNVAGWAWSSNFGWVDFNCDNGAASSTCANFYGVNVDPLERILGGYAWSNTLGWISFEENDPPDYNYTTACLDPEFCNDIGDDCTACLDQYDNIHGWAKVLSLEENGWIKASGTVENYAVTYDGAEDEFEGWSWGAGTAGNGMGWLSWNCETAPGACSSVDYAVTFAGEYFDTNVTPQAQNLSAPNVPNYCSASVRQATFRWDFVDTIDDSQSAYRLRIAHNDNPAAAIFDTGKCDITAFNNYDSTPPANRDTVCLADGTGCCHVNPTIGSQYPIHNLPAGRNPLDYNDDIYWWIEVWDQEDAASDPAAASDDGTQFTVPEVEYPLAYDFTWSPSEFSLGETVFMDSRTNARYHDGSGYVDCDDTNCNWTWEVIGGLDIDFTTPNASATLMTINEVNESAAEIRLIVEESYSGNDFQCASTTDFNPQMRLPQWIESN